MEHSDAVGFHVPRFFLLHKVECMQSVAHSQKLDSVGNINVLQNTRSRVLASMCTMTSTKNHTANHQQPCFGYFSKQEVVEKACSEVSRVQHETSKVSRSTCVEQLLNVTKIFAERTRRKYNNTQTAKHQQRRTAAHMGVQSTIYVSRYVGDKSSATSGE